MTSSVVLAPPASPEANAAPPRDSHDLSDSKRDGRYAGNRATGAAEAKSSRRDARRLDAVLAEIQDTLAPVWPLADYVAVNPFVGLANRPFLQARAELRSVRDVELLMSADYFREHLISGAISADDLVLAFEQCRREYPRWFDQESLDDYGADGTNGRARTLPRAEQTVGEYRTAGDEREYRTLAEQIDDTADTATGGDWSTAIVHEVARHCAAHYDEGQAIWTSPWKSLSLYAAWREIARHDRRFEKLGAAGFRSLVATLPDSPTEAILRLLGQLGVPASRWRGFLLAQYHSIPGWTSFVRYRVREVTRAGGESDDLTGLLAIRLAYDAGLAAAAPTAHSHVDERGDSVQSDSESVSECLLGAPGATRPSRDVLNRYLYQVAAETAYRRRLFASLTTAREPAATDSRGSGAAEVQMVFCIDVRSEIMRRHLEEVHPRLETFGFAGFFGLAMEYVPFGHDRGQSQCPVLLKPGLRVTEGLGDANEPIRREEVEARRVVRWRRQVWKAFQTSAASCFSFVESFGLGYLRSLVADSLRLGRRGDSRYDGLSAAQREHLGPVLSPCGGHALSDEQQVQFAESMLRNLGLTGSFARLVVLCAHASETTNNPYRAGLDCGACGGHSGEANARVAAQILNRGEVRAALRDRGLDIPDSVRFVAAVHVTTTDEIRFCDVAAIPATHQRELRALQHAAARAGELARRERAGRLGVSPSSDLTIRSRDWSEVRPEWGLAGNAAFIVAPRVRTLGLELGGRTFLHSYDHSSDADGRVLELIMTAPMVVTNWINLQYYASAVDNRGYGSGNKVLHNVVGQFGVFQGNGGDLMTGLPWQSVHDGRRYQHEPLRLTVVIEAPRQAIDRVLAKHDGVHDLVRNGWLTLVAIEDERFFQYIAASGWARWPGYEET